MTFYTFLPKLLNMSLTAGVAILFVMLLRLPLKKAPKVISYALWAVVLFRLLCPVSVSSGLSLFNLLDAPAVQSDIIGSSMEYVPVDIVHTEYPEVALPVPEVGEADNETLPQGEEQLRADPLEGPVFIATCVWMAGVLAMATYSAVTYIRLRRRLLTSAPLRDNIYLADEIASPFVLGLLRPRIYLPSSLAEREQIYIILHEQHHIRRLDHIVKALAFLALCIHWFNPLVWMAFVLSSKDMEMSCDEAVIKKLGAGVRADYSASLLNLATGRRIIAGVPLAFGEGDTKSRIKNLANWKKPAFWVVLVAILACIALAVGLLTNPKEETSRKEGAYYLRIGTEGVMSVEISVPHGGGGVIHADGSPFEVGEEVWLERLDGMTDLRGVSITAVDKDGKILYALSIPEDATDGEIVNIVGGDGWLLSPTTAEESSSIGIIGGADGPTSIFVSGGYHFGVTIERDGGVRGENLPNLAFHPLENEIPAYAHGLTAEQLAAIPLIPYTFPNNGDVTISYTIYSGANAPENITLTDTAIGPDGSFLHVDEAGRPIGQEAKFTREKILGGERFTCVLEPSQFNLAYSSTGPHETFRCFSLRYQTDGQWMEACFVLRTAEEYVNTAAVLTAKTHICSADLDHDGGNERIFLEEVAAGEMYSISVEEENGNMLWSEELGIPHAGWNTLLLYESGRDYLIRYKPTMYQGEGTYSCTQFHLANGRENVVNTWETDFSLPVDMTESMERFENEVNAILENSILLATTEQLELVAGPMATTEVPQLYPVRFDPDEVIAAMNEAEEGSKTITSQTAAARYAESEALFESQAPWYDGNHRVTGDWDGDGKEDSVGFKDEKRREFTVELSGSGTQSIRRIDTGMWNNGLVTENSPWGWEYYFDTGDVNGDGADELLFAIDTGAQGGAGSFCLLVCPTDGRGIDAFTQIEDGLDYRLYWEGGTDSVRIECEATGYQERILDSSLILPYMGTPEEAASRIEWMEQWPDDPKSISDDVSGFVITEDGHIVTRQYVTTPGGSHAEMYGYMHTEYAYGQDGKLQVLRSWFVHNPQV